MERENANLGMRKKSFEKARGNAEREEEMKERGHASREGPAGTRAQLCNSLVFCLILSHFLLLSTVHISCYFIPFWECHLIEGERQGVRMSQKNRELHELPYPKIIKPGTIRLASGFKDAPLNSIAHCAG